MVLNKLCLFESNKDTLNEYKIIYLTTALILDTNTHYTHINMIFPPSHHEEYFSRVTWENTKNTDALILPFWFNYYGNAPHRYL